MDLTEEEFAAMRGIISRLANLSYATESMAIEVVYGTFPPDNELQLSAFAHVVARQGDGFVTSGISVGTPQRFPLGVFEPALRIFSLMKTNGLGTDPVPRAGAAISMNVYIAMETIQRMYAALY
jgi:hypothetical protein